MSDFKTLRTGLFGLAISCILFLAAPSHAADPGGDFEPCETNWYEFEGCLSNSVVAFSNVVVWPESPVCLGTTIYASPNVNSLYGAAKLVQLWASPSAICPPIHSTNEVNPRWTTNWWEINGPGGFHLAEEDLGAVYMPTNCGEFTVTFHLSYAGRVWLDGANLSVCGGGDISVSTNFYVVNTDIAQTNVYGCVCGTSDFNLTNSCDDALWEIAPVVEGGPHIIGTNRGPNIHINNGTNCLVPFIITARSVTNTNCMDSATLTVVAVDGLTANPAGVLISNSPPTYRYCPVASNAATTTVTVTATTCPGNLDETSLPDCWTMTGGTGTNRLVRTVDLTRQATTTITVKAGTCSSNTIVIIVEDKEPPTLNNPGDVHVPTDPGECSAWLFLEDLVNAQDNCGQPELTFSPDGIEFDKGTNVITVTATDVAGNSNNCTFNLIVEDREAPTINCPGTVTERTLPGLCAGKPPADWLGRLVVSDNCGVFTVTVSPPGPNYDKGTNTITITATDDSGNVSTCTATLIIKDEESPVLGPCPKDIVVCADPSGTNYVTWTDPTATDNCPGVTVTCSPTNGSPFTLGEKIVTCTATDASGNKTNCSFKVKVVPCYQVDLDGDANHDGTVEQDGADDQLEDKKPGVLVPANGDDDDGNHVEDSRGIDAPRINGTADTRDLSPVILRRLQGAPSGFTVELRLDSPANVASDKNAGDVVRVFSSRSDTNAIPLLGPGAGNYVLPASSPDHVDMDTLRSSDIELGVEGLEFAGEVLLHMELKDSGGNVVASDDILLKVAPFILLPNTYNAEKIYVSDLDGDFAASLTSAVGAAKVVELNSATYRDKWVQDEVEMGYSQWSPDTEIPVMWNLPRGGHLDQWPEQELLKPDVGHFRMGASAANPNFGGNLEVTPPIKIGTNEYKLGWAVVGSNMDDSQKDFLARQGVQTPIIQLDVGWLAVGHVDEVIGFIPTSTGWKVMLADTRLAMSLLASLNRENSGHVTNANSAALTDATKAWVANAWQDGYVRITGGTGAGQVRQVAGNSGDSLSVKAAWAVPPDSTSTYEVVARSAYRCLFVEGDEDLGVVSGGFGHSNALVDGTKNWTANQWADGCVRIVAGPGADQEPTRIISNTADTLVMEGSITTDVTSRFVVAHRSKLRGEFRGRRDYAMISAREVMLDPNRISYNANAQGRIDGIRNKLETRLNLYTNDFVLVPALFEEVGGGGCVAWFPGMVNLLVDENTLVMPKPFGPRDQGSDIFEAAVTQGLSLGGYTLHFLDDWETYHVNLGEVHCGTNVKRALPTGVKWWELSSP